MDYLKLYDEQYFEGNASVSSYRRYSDCTHILIQWSDMVEQRFKPKSVLDVGAAYGFVVSWFRRIGVSAEGVEPSAWARSQSKVELHEGSLPVLPVEPGARAELVLCTEVMEHLPPEEVSASLTELARVTSGTLVLLIMLEGHPTAHDDAGHLTIRSREWWEAELDKTGLVPDRESEVWLDEHPFAEHIGWTGRFFVRKTPEKGVA